MAHETPANGRRAAMQGMVGGQEPAANDFGGGTTLEEAVQVLQQNLSPEAFQQVAQIIAADLQQGAQPQAEAAPAAPAAQM